MDLDKELAELQDALAMTDFNEACSKSASRPEGLAYLIVKVLRPIKIKGLRGIEWADLGAEGARKLCIS
jgi:hypothetical protein